MEETMNNAVLARATSATADKPWENKSEYSDADMLAFANREFGTEFPYLPHPDFLLVQRVVDIQATGGMFGKGYSIAEYDINPDHLIFRWHFPGKPILPGSWGVEGAWQLAGFHLTWLGARGLGMATGMGGVELRAQILPTAKRLRIRLDVELRRVSPKLSAIQGDVIITCDDQPAYEIKQVKVKVAGTPT